MELVTKGEFEKTLSLAEELQENCERYSNKISVFRIVEFITIFSVIAIILLFLREDVFNSRNIYDLLYWLASFLVMLVLLISTTEYIMVRSYIKKRRRDSRALYEIVGLLRELGEFQREKEGWSELDRAQYRIRLSRFDIGDNDSDFLHRNFMRKSESYNKEA